MREALCLYPCSQAFPLHFCILQVIKNWSWERPGNEATMPVKGRNGKETLCLYLDGMM